MKFLSSHFVAPAILVAVSAVVGCSSDSPEPTNSAGATGKAGSGAAGAAHVAGAGGAPAGGAPAGGAPAGGAPAAGAPAGGASAAGASAAGAPAGGGAAVEATFATVKSVIMSTCFGNGCHNQEGNPLQMPIDDKLYGKLTAHTTVNCGKLINTASPADSALVKVLQGDCGPMPRTKANTTPRMPWDRCFDGDVDSEFCVAPAKVAAIQAWIAKGAPQQ